MGYDNTCNNLNELKNTEKQAFCALNLKYPCVLHAIHYWWDSFHARGCQHL